MTSDGINHLLNASLNYIKFVFYIIRYISIRDIFIPLFGWLELFIVHLGVCGYNMITLNIYRFVSAPADIVLTLLFLRLYKKDPLYVTGLWWG